MKQTLLVVDDEVDNGEALERLFRKKYHVLKATSGAAALKLVQSHPEISVIISDQRMPQMSGVEFLEKSLAIRPDAVRILLTGYTDLESVIAAVNAGQIYRYVTKPWDPQDLTLTVDRAFERFQLQAELKQKNLSLQKALEELKTLDRAKSHFMVLIGHELKTPLTTLISFTDLLKESGLNSEQSRFLDRVIKGAGRLKEIVFDVLELVSAEAGTLPVNITQVSLQTLAEGIAKEFEPLAKPKKMTFAIDCVGTTVSSDPEILRKIFRRITHNAIKFGDEESIVSFQARPEGAKETHCVFQNRGPALSEEMIQHILKPFQLNENIMNHSQGLGLGLSLCQALLGRLGSGLQIQSDPPMIKVSFTLRDPIIGASNS
ncbi:MAG: hybrid sensor histidine kinase/response regulator [Bdellovibrionales bacterium]|nr:hybrid sensor histidine kinase/response regulator [Bdellovibrionales bacterium]